MGFPSPATDYVESRIDLNEIFMPNRNNTFMIETPTGFMLVDGAAKVRPGDLVAFQMEGSPMLGKVVPEAPDDGRRCDRWGAAGRGRRAGRGDGGSADAG